MSSCIPNTFIIYILACTQITRLAMHATAKTNDWSLLLPNQLHATCKVLTFRTSTDQHIQVLEVSCASDNFHPFPFNSFHKTNIYNILSTLLTTQTKTEWPKF